MAEPTTPKKPAGPRLQHVVAHQANTPGSGVTTAPTYDEVLVFGQEIDALRHTHGKTGWVYAAVQHGQSFVEALKVAQS